MAEGRVFADVERNGIRPVRVNGQTLLDLYPPLEAALAGHGLAGVLGRPEVGPSRITYATDMAATMEPFQHASGTRRAGGLAVLGRLLVALDDPALGGWLAWALLTVGDAPLLSGERVAVLGGWGLTLDPPPADPAAVLRAGIGRFEPKLVERAARYYAPPAPSAPRWAVPVGAGALVGVALGLGLWLGWPLPAEEARLRGELSHLAQLASGDVCEIAPAGATR